MSCRKPTVPYLEKYHATIDIKCYLLIEALNVATDICCLTTESTRVYIQIHALSPLDFNKRRGLVSIYPLHLRTQLFVLTCWQESSFNSRQIKRPLDGVNFQFLSNNLVRESCLLPRLKYPNVSPLPCVENYCSLCEIYEQQSKNNANPRVLNSPTLL